MICNVFRLKVCEECSNFHYSRLIIMIADSKFSQKCFWDSWILVHCQFNSWFSFIGKEKFHFSLTCSFYCCLKKEGLAMKVAYQLAIQWLVAYKLVAYKIWCRL